MSARATMAALITRLRALVSDANSTTQAFGDDELQNMLDQHCQRLDQAQMLEIATVNGSTKAIEYLTYIMPVGNWEGSPVIVDADYAAVTPSASDLLRGRWTLSTSEDPPLYITGTVYDLYGAAADALEALAAKRLLGYDELSSRFSRPRSADVRAIHAQAQRYRAQAWPDVLTVRQP